jgi:hypothetical protein
VNLREKHKYFLESDFDPIQDSVPSGRLLFVDGDYDSNPLLAYRFFDTSGHDMSRMVGNAAKKSNDTG